MDVWAHSIRYQDGTQSRSATISIGIGELHRALHAARSVGGDSARVGGKDLRGRRCSAWVSLSELTRYEMPTTERLVASLEALADNMGELAEVARSGLCDQAATIRETAEAIRLSADALSSAVILHGVLTAHPETRKELHASASLRAMATGR